MKKPEFKHVVRARDSNVTYSIYAHRPLTRDEILATVNEYNEAKFERLREGNIEIISMIGYRNRHD